MSKRKLCSGCSRPVNVCLCAVLLPVNTAVNVIVLQDKHEAKHALSTVPIIDKMLSACDVYIGEEFSVEEIFKTQPDWKRKTCLIYPSDDALPLETLLASVNEKELGTESKNKADVSHPFEFVILLDGTWRKAKRLWFLNPWLAEIPAFKITSEIKGRYQIRKAPSDDAYSTLEAVVACLAVLSPESEGELLLAAFDRMIEFQIDAMGEKTFKANYQR